MGIMGDGVAELHVDQAAGLRRLFGREHLRVITFAAGCSGVGRSIAVANLAAAFARQGREVLLLDENNGNNNASGLFGVPARHDLLHLVSREKRLSEILVNVFPGVHVLPAARAVKKLGKLTLPQQEALLAGLGEMERAADIILVDAAIDHPLGFSPLGLASQETVVVVTPGASAITEAYALIKKMSLGYARRHFRILVTKVRTPAEAEAIFDNIARVSGQRLRASLDYAGCVPVDDMLKQSVRLCQPVVTAFPDAQSSRAIRSLASDMLGWPPSDFEPLGLEQFVQQLLHLSQRIAPLPLHAG